MVNPYPTMQEVKRSRLRTQHNQSMHTIKIVTTSIIVAVLTVTIVLKFTAINDDKLLFIQNCVYLEALKDGTNAQSPITLWEIYSGSCLKHYDKIKHQGAGPVLLGR